MDDEDDTGSNDTDIESGADEHPGIAPVSHPSEVPPQLSTAIAQAGPAPVSDPNANTPIGPVTSPAATDPNEIEMPVDYLGKAPQDTGSASVSGKVSTDTKEMTSGGLAKSEALYSRHQANGRSDIAQVDADANAERQMAATGFAKKQIGINAEKEANDAYFDTQRTYLNDMAEFNNKAAGVEQQANAEIKAKLGGYMAQYQEQLAGIRQLSQTSGNPLGMLTKDKQVYLGMAAFAQGFLGAKGIKIDVTGQIDKWVDRAIEEHQLKIQNARTSAGETLNLYNIARQTSQDDYEARQRMRGFVIEAMKNHATIDAARFNSSVANAKAQEASGQLDIEAASTEKAIRDGAFDRAMKVKNFNMEAAFKMGTLAIENRKVAAQEAIARAKANQQDLKNAPLAIADPADVMRDKDGNRISGSKVKWMVAPSNVIAVKAATQAEQMFGELNSNIEKLRALREKAAAETNNEPLTSMKTLTSPAYREWDQQRNLVVAALQKSMTGQVATDAEAQRFLKAIGDDSFWQKGNNAFTLDSLQGWARRGFQNTMENTPGIIALPDGMQHYSGKVEVDPQGQALDRAHESVVEGSDIVGKEEAQTIARDKGDEAMAGYTQAYSDFLNKTGKTIQGDQGQPRELLAIDHLASLLVIPENGVAASPTIRGKPTVDSDTIKTEAKTALEKIAAGETLANGKQPSDEAQEYAKYVLSNLNDNPDEASDYYGWNTLAQHMRPEQAQHQEEQFNSVRNFR